MQVRQISRKFSSNVQNFFKNSRNWGQKWTLLRKPLSRKSFSDYLENIFLTLKKKPDHISKIIPLKSKVLTKRVISLKRSYLSSRNYCADVAFFCDNTTEELTKTAIFFAQIPVTFVQTVIFPKCLFFLSEVLSTTRMQLWQHC